MLLHFTNGQFYATPCRVQIRLRVSLPVVIIIIIIIINIIITDFREVGLYKLLNLRAVMSCCSGAFSPELWLLELRSEAK
jgi:hypothetical protein